MKKIMFVLILMAIVLSACGRLTNMPVSTPTTSSDSQAASLTTPKSEEEEAVCDTTDSEDQTGSGEGERGTDVIAIEQTPLVVKDDELGELRIMNVVQWPYIDISEKGNVKSWNADYKKDWLFVDVEIEMPESQADQPLEIDHIVLTDGDGNTYKPFNLGTQVRPKDGFYMWLFFELVDGDYKQGGGYLFSGDTPSGHVFAPCVSYYDTLILGGASTIDSLPPGGRGWIIDKYKLPGLSITPVRAFSIAFEIPEDITEWTLQLSGFNNITLPVPVLQESSDRTWGTTISMTRDEQNKIWEQVGLSK